MLRYLNLGRFVPRCLKNIRKSIESGKIFGKGWSSFCTADEGYEYSSVYKDLQDFSKNGLSVCFVLMNGYDDIIGFIIDRMKDSNEFNEW